MSTINDIDDFYDWSAWLALAPDYDWSQLVPAPEETPTEPPADGGDDGSGGDEPPPEE